MNRCALLIPHFNNPAGLCASLASIGTDEQIDVVIVDDGSVRRTIDEDAARLAFKGRGELKFYYLPHNCGIEYALNTGLEAILAAGYEYCARLDCDDVVVPDRFAKQVKFLDANSSVYLLGSAVTFFDASGDRFTINQPLTHEAIVWQMHNDNAFTHPTVMFRMAGVREIGLYPTDCKAAEDFAYFWAFVARYQTANLAEVLTKSEYNDSGISMSRRRQQQAMRIKILARYFDWKPKSAMNIAKASISAVLPVVVGRAIKRVLGVKKWN
ncbi:glycosyltransferase [Chitinibacter bivalviorum]|uniref:Glycosyltransferase n=1 Tax=Chitinibacter bivalviorum TaxID=2739434 RepID=A0A7H9BJF2_9NEIS|nr:glycosyltransferase [Chitinibacter bivalviorum]QLG88795.1 glycosyltransferase [Chitinibacter bivalviorum]